MIDPITAIVAAVAASLGAIVTAILQWKKSEPEVDSIVATTTEKLVAVAGGLIDTLRQELADRMETLEVLEVEIRALQTEVKRLEEQIRTLIAILVEHGVPYDEFKKDRGRNES